MLKEILQFIGIALIFSPIIIGLFVIVGHLISLL